jgi:hypothetical protein
MQAQLWSISGLSVQLGIDRRTLAKRLEGLTPASVEERGNGAKVRRYKLAEVVEHLNRDKSKSESSGPSDAQVDEAASGFLGFVGRDVLPGMIENSAGILTGALVDDLGITKPQALRALELVFGSLIHGLHEGAPGREIPYVVPPIIEGIRAQGPESFAAEHWPDV